MEDVRKEVNELSEKLKNIKAHLGLGEKLTEIGLLEAESHNPDLWNDPDHARSVMQNLSDLKKEVDEVEKISSDLKTLEDLANENLITPDLEKDVERIKGDLNKLELSSFLSDSYDRKNAIVSIHAGQGGTEAMDWSNMLFRMYLRFAEKRGWATSVVDLSSGEEAGIKSVTFKVNGAYAYGYMKGESGTHRLVRQSPFNADNLRQTSFALVEVLPELEEKDLPDIVIKDEDLDVQFFRASSQGGQNVQKVSTAVRLTHKPTGIVVTAQAERFQEQNRKNALNLLRAKLWARRKEEEKATKKALKGEYRPASWGTQIRSYVLHPYKMVKDLRTGVETGNAEAVLDGDLDEFVEAELKNTTS